MLAIFTSLINFGAGLNMVKAAFFTVLLTIDGWIYQLLSFVFNLFLIICGANMSTIANIAKPLVDRLQAVVMVLIVYKIGTALIQALVDPEKASPSEGGKLITNIFIATVLLVSYNFIFGLLNDVSLLIVGNPTNYPYTTLSHIIKVDQSDNKGLIMRFVFGGDDSAIKDIGDYLAYNTAAIFVHDYNNPESSTVLRSKICSSD